MDQKKPAPMCATCQYSRLLDADPNNIGKRQLICKWGPPQCFTVPVQSPAGQIGMQLSTAHPAVPDDGWCSRWDDGLSNNRRAVEGLQDELYGPNPGGTD